MSAIQNPTSYIVKSRKLLANKRRSALMTLWLPIIGSIVAIISAWFTGIGYLEIFVLFLMYIWSGLGVEVGYHRLFAHKAFETSRFMKKFWWISGLMAGQGIGTYWVATHRRHHIYSDTLADPHSPLTVIDEVGNEKLLKGIRGLWHAHQGYTYTGHATNVGVFANDVIKEEMYKKLDKQYHFWLLVGLLIPAVIGGIVYQSWIGVWNCFLWGGPLRIFFQHQTYFTNSSLAHAYGEQPYDTGDNSRNNWYCSLWTFGGSLQNTHHAFATSAFLKQKWYEFDLAGTVIKVLGGIGLATNIKSPSATQIRSKLKNYPNTVAK